MCSCNPDSHTNPDVEKFSKCIVVTWQHCWTSLQALSKRIHYGKFVAEAKFQASPDAYEAAIKAQVKFFFFAQSFLHFLSHIGFMIHTAAGFHIHFCCWHRVLQDSQRLMDMLTYQRVEDVVKMRVEMKTKAYGQEVVVNGMEDDDAGPVYKIKPSLVADLYGDWIMPLTKEVQVAYLLRRLD